MARSVVMDQSVEQVSSKIEIPGLRCRLLGCGAIGERTGCADATAALNPQTTTPRSTMAVTMKRARKKKCTVTCVGWKRGRRRRRRKSIL